MGASQCKYEEDIVYDFYYDVNQETIKKSSYVEDTPPYKEVFDKLITN